MVGDAVAVKVVAFLNHSLKCKLLYIVAAIDKIFLALVAGYYCVRQAYFMIANTISSSQITIGSARSDNAEAMMAFQVVSFTQLSTCNAV